MKRSNLLDRLARQILTLASRHSVPPRPLRVAIDGVDASGKTTLAAELAVQLAALAPSQPVIQSSIDRFHNPRAIRYRLGPDSPEGYYADSFDLAALRQNLLEPLGPSGSRIIRSGLFDFRTDSSVTAKTFEAAPNAILILDGVFLQRPELVDCWDLVIFVQVAFETVLERVVERDADLFGSPQAIRDRYEKRYLPAQRDYLKRCQPMENADVVVFNDEPSNPTFQWQSSRSSTIPPYNEPISNRED